MPRARVLAVDDQSYFRTFLADLLAELGYEVRTATGAEEALHLLEREPFDVVLTDLVMPEVNGVELVQRIRERWPAQEVVVVSGVGDVATAVEAMKLGVTDYLVKPVDRQALDASLAQILERRRLREEHRRLVEENLEFIGVLSLHERAMGFFASLALEPLAERIGQALSLETRAQGAVAWIAPDADAARLELLTANGLVRVEEEPRELSAELLPPELEPLRKGLERSLVVPGEDGASLLYVPLRHGGRLLGVVRLSDRLDGGAFDDRDRAVAERLAEYAALALDNALRFEALERRSFRDPTTKAYTRAYLEDAVRNELYKSSRFGRSFSLIRLRLDSLDPLRERLSPPELGRWLESLVEQVGRTLRATDLVAAESESRYTLLLPETHALGAAVLKRRLRQILEASDLLRNLPAGERPLVLLAAACFPEDGSQVEELDRALEERLEQDRASLLRGLDVDSLTFAATVDALLERGRPAPEGIPEDLLAFLLSEVGRRPREPGLLFLSPGNRLAAPAREGLQRLRGLHAQAEVVLLSEVPLPPDPGLPLTRVPPSRAGTTAPFAIYFGTGPAYALICDEAGAEAPLFHTSDRSLVEHLAFQLQRDLGISLAHT